MFRGGQMAPHLAEVPLFMLTDEEQPFVGVQRAEERMRCHNCRESLPSTVA